MLSEKGLPGPEKKWNKSCFFLTHCNRAFNIIGVYEPSFFFGGGNITPVREKPSLLWAVGVFGNGLKRNRDENQIEDRFFFSFFAGIDIRSHNHMLWLL